MIYYLAQIGQHYTCIYCQDVNMKNENVLTVVMNEHISPKRISVCDPSIKYKDFTNGSNVVI